MRTIKFRGIDTMSGEMVYGDLVQQELTDGSITTAIVYDDIITTGSTIRAMADILREKYKNVLYFAGILND